MAETSKKSLTDNLEPVTKTKFHEQIVAQVRSLIEKGRLIHGDQLPPERELARRFKVSRHSVREAIRVLEQQNVLKSRPGSGTYVIVEDASTIIDSLTNAILREKIQLTEIFEFREMLEPQIAALAAHNATDKDMKDLKDLLERQEKEIDNAFVSKELDEKFHLALASAAGNTILLHVVELFSHILLKSRHENIQSLHRRMLSVKGHKKIFHAISMRDAKAAKHLMAGHLQTIRKLVISSDTHQTNG